MFGFLGPNGAGKTTSVKMLLGLVPPTGGDRPPARRAAGRPAGARPGWLSARALPLPRLADRQRVPARCTPSLYHMPAAVAERRIAELLELVGLTPHAGKKLRAFSKGMLQRIGLAQALLNQPELVILDEPTSGLDPVGRRLVRDIIRELRAERHDRLPELAPAERGGDHLRPGGLHQARRGASASAPLQSLVEGELSVAIRARKLTPEIVDGLAALEPERARWTAST